MRSGKYNSALPFYAALAFLLAIMGQTFLCGALMCFVIVAENDQWLDIQVIQAMLLCITSSVVSTALKTIDILSAIPLANVISKSFNTLIIAIVNLFVLIFAIIAIVNVVKGKDANVPGYKKVAAKVCGIFELSK